MVEGHGHIPEEARAEEARGQVLGLLRGIEDFPTMKMFSNESGEAVETSGLIIDRKKENGINFISFVIADKEGIYEVEIDSKVSLTGNGAISQLPILETMVEIPVGRYSEYKVLVEGRVDELKQRRKNRTSTISAD